jgi:mono/diheme cytochrome c family protein
MKMFHMIFTLVVAVSVVAGSGGVSVFAAGKENSLLERGKYLVQLAGCNDCHTSGYLLSGGDVAEELWLTGDSFGWRGPWGTTYAPNLRLRLQDFTEEEWLVFARQLKARPPMPWYTVNQMKEEDLRAIYRYVRHSGPAGKPAPSYVPPGVEPTTPYALFPSPPDAK